MAASRKNLIVFRTCPTFPLAKEIVAGTRDLHDTTLALSDAQIQILQALKSQLDAITQIERQLAEIERQREAMLPPVVPLDVFVAFQPAIAFPVNRAIGVSAVAVVVPDVATRRAAGLKPASQLGGGALLSGDAHVNAIVSVNVAPRVMDNDGQIATLAQYLTYNPANGAIPVAIEFSGDRDYSALAVGDTQKGILKARAYQSALFVIDPARLSDADQTLVERHAAGELGISGVPAAAIVAVVVPSSFGLAGMDVISVGDRTADVYCAAKRGNVSVQHPDYASGIAAILGANRRKTLVFHVTRFGSGTKLT